MYFSVSLSPRRPRGFDISRPIPCILCSALCLGWAITWVSLLLHLIRVVHTFEFCIHSLANQEVLRWQLAMQNELGDNITHQDIKDYLWKTLKSGQVVPGLVAYFSCRVLSSKLLLATGMVSCESRTPVSSRFRSSAIADQSYSRVLQSSW
jgi:hypothetical protein